MILRSMIATVAAAGLGTATVATLQQRSTDLPKTQLVDTVKDIMKAMDAPTRRIRSAIRKDVSPAGRIERQPKTTTEWQALERDTVALMDAASLLKVPGRPVALPDESHRTTSSHPNERTPADIAERIARSPHTFVFLADQLYAASRKAQEAARARSPEAFLEARQLIDKACVACHQTYWYAERPRIPPPIR